MKKTGLLALGLALAIGVVAEAGSIPTDRVPLQTYAVKKLNCYLQPNGVQKGWIDPGDYVVVTQIRSDGWAYGSYPVGNGRVSRWFRADDLVNNIGFANQERYSPKANTYTYTNPNHNKQFGSFNDNEPILVVSDSGQSRQFIYKLNSGGYKMAWAPYWDCWDARQAGKQQVNNNMINTNPIVKPVQREEKKQEQSSSYGVWKATARYRANTYDNPNLSGARAGWVTAGSDLEVLGENSKSYYIRYWTDNGTPRERYVERTAVKGLNEDKDNKKQVNNNTINTNPIVKPVQREEKKQEQSSSYGVWKATARYRANTYDNPNLSGARAGWVTAGSDLEVLGENAKSYYIRYWTDNGTPRARYVERTAVKGLNEDKDNKKQEQSSYKVWSTVTSYTANTYDTPDLSGTRAGWVTSGSRIEVLGENVKSYYIRYWNDSGKPREKYVAKNAVKVLGNLPNNPIVKPVQREDKKQEQTSYGVWKATARYTANTYDNPDLRGMRAGRVTSGSDIEVLGENAKSYFIRYWADNGAKRERYVERTAVKGLDEDKDNKNVVPSGDYVWPIDEYQITCLYYYQTGKNHSSLHKGYTFDYMNSIDVSATYGTPVYATASGVVDFVLSKPNSTYPEKSYGRHIIIKHYNGKYSLYAHLSKTLVSRNQKVSQGEKIGESGYSVYYDEKGNRRESNHLHFAITEISPWQYFRDKYNFSYHVNCKNNNKNKNDQYSKELIEWFNKNNPKIFTNK